jgi:peptidoglycan/xylan/chitin deacetylase (PgdA/CDA1 family)
MAAPRLASSWGRVWLLVACGACLLSPFAPSWLAAASWALLLCVIGAGVAFHGSGVFGRPVQSFDTSRPEVAITIDDGPDPQSTPALLDLLDSHGQRATFFVLGSRAQAQPELLGAMSRRGHQVENHSLKHAYTTPFLTPRKLAKELAQASEIIQAATGRAPRYFRPPVGLLSPRVVRAARLAGLQLVGWSGTARDGAATTEARALARLQRALVPGAVLVLHDHRDGGPPALSVTLLPRLLDLLAARGLRSVTLDELARGDG